MIRLVDSTRVYGDGEPTIKLFADTQDEVESGEIVGWSGQVPAGSTIYTADGANGIYKSDGTVAWQGGSATPSFTITSQGETHTYEFEADMTWESFIASDYNIDQVFSGEAYVHYEEDGSVMLDDREIETWETIINGAEYDVMF